MPGQLHESLKASSPNEKPFSPTVVKPHARKLAKASRRSCERPGKNEMTFEQPPHVHGAETRSFPHPLFIQAMPWSFRFSALAVLRKRGQRGHCEKGLQGRSLPRTTWEVQADGPGVLSRWSRYIGISVQEISSHISLAWLSPTETANTATSHVSPSAGGNTDDRSHSPDDGAMAFWWRLGDWKA